MSDNNTIELKKKAAIVDTILLSKGITNAPTMRVWGALDISGSMDDEIRDGSLQSAMDQLLGVAFKFDDNGEIDILKFDTRADYVGVAKPSDFGTFIKSKGITSRGATSFNPIIDLVAKKCFSASDAPTPAPAKTGLFGWGKKVVDAAAAAVAGPLDNTPVLLIVLTDGAPGESVSELTAAFSKYANLPIYTQIIGISNQPGTFRKAQSLADALPNVGFVPLSGFKLSDQEVYSALISPELMAWVAKFPTAPVAVAV